MSFKDGTSQTTTTTTTTTTKKKRPTSDVFSVLMSTQSQKKKKVPTRFVLCPAGCGVHVPETRIHFHLDQCISLQQEALSTQQEATAEVLSLYSYIENKKNSTEENDTQQEESGEASLNGGPTACTRLFDSPKTDAAAPVVRSLDLCETKDTLRNVTPSNSIMGSGRPSLQNNTRKNDVAVDDNKNAFLHMMARSRQIFSQPSTSPAFYFWLRPGDKDPWMVSLETRMPAEDRIAWQATVRVYDRSHAATQHFHVSLCSSIQSAGNGIFPHFQQQQQQQQHSPIPPRRRWVKLHSRFSVPVLKSMLQKSIRRRRPLPSVRIAMELADKSLGDLLRRLPIIVLEDSTLHPHFPFLVWLMMAHSSASGENAADSFHVPNVLLERVFEIIFEVASCRLRDPLAEAEEEGKKVKNQIPGGGDDKERDQVSLSFISEQIADQTKMLQIDPETLLIPCAILMRACYGGMKCDITMLQGYAQLWYERFLSLTSDTTAAQHPLPPMLSSSLTWRDVPTALHEAAHAKRNDLVAPLLQTGLDRLTMDDLCCEGVDFHCSNVMDHLLQDDHLVGLASDILLLAGNGENDTMNPFASLTPKQRLAWLGKTWKSDMWTHCSGVNHRLSLWESSGESQQHQQQPSTTRTKIWKELVEPKVTTYQKDYAQQRLASF